MATTARSVYVHIPFCRHRCGYCNFTVTAGRKDLHEPLLRALELEFQTLNVPRPIDTLYIGGGTPTQLSIEHLRRLCCLMRHWFPPTIGYEWSMEANPSDLDSERMEALVESGITRISLGVQSFDAGKLTTLERTHRAADVRRVFHEARRHFASVSLDLIFAVPGETLAQWQNDLQSAIDLNPDHLSTYGLTYERGARFFGLLRRGKLRQVDEETERAMYEWTIDRLVSLGWEHYEVSNFAKPGHRCRHNEVYWKGEPFFAAGPGAARYIDGQREVNHRSTTTYLKRVLAGQSPVAERQRLSPEDRAREQLVFQLRMLEGVSYTAFAARTGFRIEQLAGTAIREYTALGFFEQAGDRIRLSRRGLLVSDAIWPELL